MGGCHVVDVAMVMQQGPLGAPQRQGKDGMGNTNMGPNRIVMSVCDVAWQL